MEQSVCEWIERFKNGGTSITEAELRKLPFTSNTDKDIKHVGGMILDKRRVTTDDKSFMFPPMKSSTTHWGFIRFVKDFFPGQLTEEQKHKCLDICQHL